MSNTFPVVRHGKTGYSIDEVENFLLRARNAYDAQQQGTAQLTADMIRHTAFSMQKGGYSTQHVDEALERLEDVFAARERDVAYQTKGDEIWFQETRATAQIILNRLSREGGRRFDRTSRLTVGYNIEDVDTFVGKLLNYFQEGMPMSVDDVRTAVFRPQKSGYREVQVDLVLDSVVDVMLAVR